MFISLSVKIISSIMMGLFTANIFFYYNNNKVKFGKIKLRVELVANETANIKKRETKRVSF